MAGQENTSKQQKMGLIKSFKTEVKKITWPTKKELRDYVIVVLIVCIAISIFVGLIDAGLHQLITKTIIGK